MQEPREICWGADCCSQEGEASLMTLSHEISALTRATREEPIASYCEEEQLSAFIDTSLA